MDLKNYRYSSKPDSSGGALQVDGEFQCYICEDEHRDVKVMGETRVSAGRYRILLRDEGGKTQRYAAKFPDFHRGMLWLQGVPNFKWVYIHIGNDDDDTEGCLLTGYSAHYDGENTVSSSTKAYVDLYKKILAAMDRGEEVWIEIIDL